MATDVFLKIDGIPGESTDDKHQGWIELTGFQHRSRQPYSMTASSSGGATAERVNFAPFCISKLVDKATPKIFEASVTGKHIKEVTIEVCRAGGDKQKYLEIKMEHVIISDYGLTGGGEFPTEGLSLVPGIFKINYIQQKRSDGVGGGSVAAGWSLMENKTVA